MLRVKSLAKTNEVANITMSERPVLLLQKRIELIKCAESVPKPELKALSSRFAIGKSTVGDILKRKEIYKWFNSGDHITLCVTRNFFVDKIK